MAPRACSHRRPVDFSVRCPVLVVGFGTRSVVAFVLFVVADLVFVEALGPAGAAGFVVLAGVDAVVLALVLAGALGPLGVRPLLADRAARLSGGRVVVVGCSSPREMSRIRRPKSFQRRPHLGGAVLHLVCRTALVW